jgi:hypothetical protein
MTVILMFVDEAVTVENSVNIEEDLLSGIGKQKPKHKWNALIALTQRLVADVWPFL